MTKQKVMTRGDLERYDAALERRSAGKATLGDAVAIARGRPGPPAVPVSFDSPDFGNCKSCNGSLIMLRVRLNPQRPDFVLAAACLNCDVVKS